jgi:SAM-dependent methyltransferase
VKTHRGAVRDFRAAVSDIRRTRLHPSFDHYLYLHLRRLRNEICAQLEMLPLHDVLDVYCGAKPYEPLFGPGVNYLGLDIDDAYGCADVVSTELLPFPDGAFDLCLCTQAFQFVPDAKRAVTEFARVLRPGGHALLTVPTALPRGSAPYSGRQLMELFREWDDVVVRVNGGTAITIFIGVAWAIHQVERRLPRVARRFFAPIYIALNVAGEGADVAVRRLPRLDGAWPMNLVVRARRAS